MNIEEFIDSLSLKEVAGNIYRGIYKGTSINVNLQNTSTLKIEFTKGGIYSNFTLCTYIKEHIEDTVELAYKLITSESLKDRLIQNHKVPEMYYKYIRTCQKYRGEDVVVSKKDYEQLMESFEDIVKLDIPPANDKHFDIFFEVYSYDLNKGYIRSKKWIRLMPFLSFVIIAMQKSKKLYQSFLLKYHDQIEMA